MCLSAAVISDKEELVSEGNAHLDVAMVNRKQEADWLNDVVMHAEYTHIFSPTVHTAYTPGAISCSTRFA